MQEPQDHRRVTFPANNQTAQRFSGSAHRSKLHQFKGHQAIRMHEHACGLNLKRHGWYDRHGKSRDEQLCNPVNIEFKSEFKTSLDKHILPAVSCLSLLPLAETTLLIVALPSQIESRGLVAYRSRLTQSHRTSKSANRNICDFWLHFVGNERR